MPSPAKLRDRLIGLRNRGETAFAILSYSAMDEGTLIRVREANQAFKLTIAENLGRIWSDVLDEPLPDDLQRLIRKLERVTHAKQKRRDAHHRTVPEQL